MSTRLLPVLAVSSLALVASLSSASAATVNEIGGASDWQATDVRPGGAAGIVDLTGLGGDLEADAPLGKGVLKLTTDLTTTAKAEVTVTNPGGDFGSMAAFIAGGSLTYSFFKANVPGGNASAAASIKLTVLDADSPASDKYGTFVYEPTWNQAVPNAPSTVPTDSWFTVFIDGMTGMFWHTGIYGEGNMGGAPGMTLSDWDDFFGGDLASAIIVGISLGVGSGNAGQVAYVDEVGFTDGEFSKTWDFEVAAVPGPAALPLLLTGIGAMGVLAMRKKKATAVAA